MRGKKLHKEAFDNAYIIHQQAFLERKLRLTLLCKSHGVVHAIANRPSKKKGPLQLFTPMSVQLKLGKQLATVHAIEPQGYLPMYQAKALLAGMYFNELIYRLCSPQSDDDTLYNCYEQHIAGLLQVKEQTLHIRLFEHKLQIILGFALHYTCLDHPSHYFSYDPEHGLIPAPNSHPEKIPRDILQALANEQWQDPNVQQLSKHIFAKVVKNLLGEQSLAINQLFKSPHTCNSTQATYNTEEGVVTC